MQYINKNFLQSTLIEESITDVLLPESEKETKFTMIAVSVNRRLQPGRKMQTEGKMRTEDCRPGVKCRFSSETTHFPGKTSRVRWIEAA